MNKITLKDIAGYEVEKQEALKIINFLKNYEEYIELGIKLPKGLLLSGIPGVGKTLLAKAIANESGANFVEFKTNEDSTIQNIRDTFAKAKAVTPSILFIDELDEIVTCRYGEVTDEQKKTLQAFLTEIDGLTQSLGVIVIATCNQKGDIPMALTRSGRLEKHMTISKPSFEARVKIFDLYMSKHDILNDIDRELLAKKSNGLTGADICNLTNEVLLECNSKGTKPTLDDFERYIPQILFKDVCKQNNSELLEFVLAHEIGHFITTFVLKNEISSITVDKYGEVAGFISRNRKEAEVIKSSSFLNDITILLSGLAGEKAILNDMTTGAIDDISRANDMIEGMLNIGVYGFEYFKERRMSPYHNDKLYPESKIKMREDKIASILNDSLERAVNIIKDNINIYHLLVDELRNEGRLSSERIKQIFIANNIKVD